MRGRHPSRWPFAVEVQSIIRLHSSGTLPLGDRSTFDFVANSLLLDRLAVKSAKVIDKGNGRGRIASRRQSKATAGTGCSPVCCWTGCGQRTNGNGLIEINELVDYVEEQVPDLSYAAFGLRQVPTKNLQGNNFPLTSKVAVLPTTSASPASIPTKPTHVVVTPATVRQTADGKAAAVIELAPSTQVRLVETAGGWVLIARDGKRLGYIEGRTLLALQ
jgi:hypothetical protein